MLNWFHRLIGGEAKQIKTRAEINAEFLHYLKTNLLSRFLTVKQLCIAEIGPGGRRVTKLLVDRCRILYCIDISPAMLGKLKNRFSEKTNIRYILTDGIELTEIEDNHLDAVVSFDAFIHIDPAGIFNYLAKIKPLLRTGGIGIIHFADIETEIGWRLFRSQVDSTIRGASYANFSVMNKSIM